MKVSLLVPFSVGMVASNKKRARPDGKPDRMIEVTPIETSQFLNGEVTDNTDVEAVAGVSADGRAFDHKLNSTSTVNAEWIPYERGVVTPPDVRRGMKVMLYKFADVDKYYWRYMGLDDDKFCLETFIVRWSGTQGEADGVDADNDYYLEVSTHDGLVHLHTGTGNGEPHAWDLQLNTKESRLIVQDDIENKITIESETGLIELKNYVGTFIKLEEENIDGYAAGTTTWECPQTNWTGNWAIKGNFDLTGNYSQTGNFVLTGNGECSGTFKAGKIISVQNAQAPNIG